MAELIPLGGHTYYIPGPTNVGVYEQAGTVCLFDSGFDEAAAEQALDLLTACGWQVEAVYNTHYHADHIGGNALIQSRTGCRCYCPQPQFAAEPIMNPAFLYSAAPPKTLQSAIFLAQPSDTRALTPDCLPEGITRLALPGHCYEQYGFRTPDGVLFAGDCLLGWEELERPQFCYLYSYPQHLASLDRLSQETGRWFVPAHGSPVQELQPLLERNRSSFVQTREQILALCAGDGASQDELLKAIFDGMHRHLHLAKYALTCATLHAYLADLMDAGLILARSKENVLRYRAARQK